jgi:molybdopterin molybdotransferase
MSVPQSRTPRSVAEHQQAVVDLIGHWTGSGDDGRDDTGTGTVPLLQARGRILARDVTAPRSLPGFDNSQMDGYAVHSAAVLSAGLNTAGLNPAAPAAGDRGGRIRLDVAAPIPAGIEPPPLKPGTAAPIMTGAMMPAGADAVVPIEAAEPPSFLPPGAPDASVGLPADVPTGQFVRTAGSDIAAGSVALRAGTVLGPAQLGLLAALGVIDVTVRRRPEVLLLTTGDEVAEPGSPLAPGQIYDANSTMLHAALLEAGLDVRRMRLLADSVDGFRTSLAAELRTVPDLVLSTGGISKGAYEVVRQALAEHDVAFLSVAMQPGGPQGIGTIDAAGKRVPFLGFPGNPVSTLVSFEMFLRPALSQVLGTPAPRRELAARLAEDVSSPAGKHQVRRGRYPAERAGTGDGGTVALVGGPGSHLVHALAESNALVHIPADVTELHAGDEVRIWLL